MRKLVSWFRAQVERPELYAAMMITVDDGPYVGLDLKIDRAAPAIASAQVSDDLTREGHRTTIGAAEGYAIRALYEGRSGTPGSSHGDGCCQGMGEDVQGESPRV